MLRMPDRRNRPDGHDPAAALSARPPSAWFAVLIIALAAGSASALLLPYALAVSATRLLTGRGLAQPALAVAALLLLGMVAQVAGEVCSAACTGRATARARRTLLGSVLELGVPGTARYAPGDLISRLVGNCADAGQAPAATAEAVVSFATSLLAVAALWWVDPWLGAAFLAGLLPVLLLVRLFVRRTGELFMEYQGHQSGIAARLTDALAGIRTIRACGTAEREVARVLEPLPRLSRTGRRIWAAQSSVIWRMSLLAPALEITVLSIAGLLLAAGRIAPGDLLAAAGYTTLALGFLNQMDSLGQLARARAGARRAGEVCAEACTSASASASATGARPRARPAPGPGRVELRGVTVQTGEHSVLEGVDLDIAPGSTLALVGTSGSGKSTLAALLGRLVEPARGEVLLDGTRLAELDTAQLRREVAYAFERPALLGATVHEAVTYCAPQSSRTAAVRAAELARADGFIRRLPQGYDTPLRGLALSGGEAQRLGLARALAQDARVLVLDDATSSLDTLTEMQISHALTEALAGRTRIVVTQRAATARRADVVAWLEGGRLRATAAHDELWQDPDYRAVFNVSAAV
jgi:ATP-binding cassette subfamily B protein